MRRLLAALLILPLASLTILAFADEPASAPASAPAAKPEPDKEGFYSLWNGKDKSEWKIGVNPDLWKVENGELITFGKSPSHLFYNGPVNNADFKNFHFSAQVMTTAKANSGIYFHTKFQEKGFPNNGFECQVNQTHSDTRKTGGLYGVKDVMKESPVKDNEWFTYEIIVTGKHVVIKINGKETCDWTEAENAKPAGGFSGRLIGHGTFALQGHGPDGEAHYKDIKVKPLPDDAK
jgi:hypothetical protein